MFDVKYVGILSSACIWNGMQGRFLVEWLGRDSKQIRDAVHTVLDPTILSPMRILRDEIPSKEFNYAVNRPQIILRLNSTLIFSVTATSEGPFPPLEGSLCLIGPIIIVLHLFLAKYFEPSIGFFQLHGGNPPLAELKASQSDQWRILYPMTSDVCAFSTSRCVGSPVVGLCCWDNLRTTQFALWYMRSEWYKWYVVQKQHPASYTVLTMSPKYPFEACRFWGASWLWKMKA